jgi:rhodanese-related sulfurtransferase
MVAAQLRSGSARGWAVGEVVAGAAARPGTLALVDVGDGGEFRAATLPGALGVPLGELRERLGELPRGKLVFVSGSGRRGHLAARIVGQHGRRDAGFLVGGLRSWVAAGQPLARGGP